MTLIYPNNDHNAINYLYIYITYGSCIGFRLGCTWMYWGGAYDDTTKKNIGMQACWRVIDTATGGYRIRPFWPFWILNAYG